MIEYFHKLFLPENRFVYIDTCIVKADRYLYMCLNKISEVILFLKSMIYLIYIVTFSLLGENKNKK